nr:MAG TPA: hypothetical protein [Caudoviricetes sp.]
MTEIHFYYYTIKPCYYRHVNFPLSTFNIFYSAL